MTLTLHLGVQDIPYKDDPKGKTSYDVAEILEAKYHPMEIFFNLYDEKIARDLEEGLAGVLEAIIDGRSPLALDPFGAAMSITKAAFVAFIINNEMNALGYPGIPTAASGQTEKRKGSIQHRKAHPYSKDNPARPSFVDTGEYIKDFMAWID